MADDNLNLSAEQLKRAEELKDIFKDIRDATRESNNALKEAGQTAVDYGGIYSSIANSASKVAEFQSRIKKSSKETKKVLEEKEKVENNVRRLNAKINDLYDKAASATGDVKENLLRQARNLGAAKDEAEILSKIYGEIAEDSAKLDKSTKFFGGLAKVVKDLPILRKFAAPFEKAEEAARKVVAATGDSAAGFKAGMEIIKKGVGSFFSISTAITLIVKAFKFIISAGLAVNKQTVQLQKGLNLSASEADSLRDSLRQTGDVANNAFATTAERVNSLVKLNEQFGTSSRGISNNLLDQAIKLEKQVGLSAEQTGELSKMFLLTKEGTDQTVESLIGASYELQAQNGIALDNKKVLAEISGVTGTLRANFAGSNQELAKAVTTAQMLGLNLKSIEGIQSSLLDFEGSISAELEAELLTGKQLNLERARAAALNNDYATVAKEITSQVGSLADFQNMNAIAQEAIAKAVGMTKDSFADMLVQQDLLGKLGLSEKATMQERLAAAEKLKKEGADLNTVLGEGVYENLQQLTIQEKLNAQIEQMKQIFVDEIGPSVANLLEKFTSNDDMIGNIIEKIRGMARAFKTLMPIVVGLGAGLMVAATAIATAAIAATLGTAAIPIAIGIGTVAAATAAGIGTHRAINDGMIDSDGGMIVSGPKGSIKLNKDDQIVAGTDLFGGSGNNSRLEEKIDKLATAIMNKPTVLNVDGKRFGEISNNTTGAYTYTLER